MRETKAPLSHAGDSRITACWSDAEDDAGQRVQSPAGDPPEDICTKASGCSYTSSRHINV